MEGERMRKVEVSPYNNRWSSMFDKEANVLREIFGSQIVEIHHIGSTSVKGLNAKPVIDIMPVVKIIHKVDLFNEEMKKSGYEPVGENGLAGRRFFQKGGNNRSHHIHVYQLGNPEIDRHLAFRDYLREHLIVATQYGNLKEKLSQQFPSDIGSYIAGKEQLIVEIEHKALSWYRMKK